MSNFLMRQTQPGAYFITTQKPPPQGNDLTRHGWRWHGCTYANPRCNACASFVPIHHTWWTADPEIAATMIHLAAPPLAAAIRALTTNAAANLAASHAKDATIDIPAPAGYTYLPYQRAGIQYMKDRPATLLADEMGLGKTIQTIGLINLHPDWKNVLVLCPASLRLNWMREFRRWLTHPFDIHLCANGAMPDLCRSLFGDGIILISNYEQLTTSRAAKYLRATINLLPWDLLVCDEAHYLKSPGSQRTKAVLGAAAHGKNPAIPGIHTLAKTRVFLTGTPILNRPAEIWPLAHTLAPERFPSWAAFQRTYCSDPTTGKISNRAANNLDDLQRKLRSSIMCRRLKADVLKDLPPRRHQVIPLEPTNAEKDLVQREIDLQAKIDARKTANQRTMDDARARGDDKALAQAVRSLIADIGPLQAHVSIVRHQLALAKVPHVIDHVDELLHELQCLVLFAHHQDVIAAFRAHWKEAAVTLVGGMRDHERQKSIDDFQAGRARVFLGSIDAAGLGITLTRASTVIFAEQAWTPGSMTQAIDRLHRIGQQDTVLAQYLVFDGSLDAKIANTIQDKKDVIAKALDERPSAPHTAS